MSYYRKLVLLSLLALLVFSLGVSNAEETTDYCKKCSNTGKIVDKRYPVPYPYYCSSSLDPSRSCDAGWMPCEKCVGTRTNAEARKEFQDWVDSLTAWTNGRRNEIDKKIFGANWEKCKVIHVETGGWIFATNLVGRRMDYICLPHTVPKWLAVEMKIDVETPYSKLKKMKIIANSDLAARIYAERLEYFYKFFLAVFERDLRDEKPKKDGDDDDDDDTLVEEEDEPEEEEVKELSIDKVGVGGGKFGFYIWLTEEMQKAASHVLAGSTSGQGVTLYSTWSLHTVHDSDRGSDEMLLHKVVHSATQVVVSDYLKYERDSVPDWFIEGLAHWMEYILLGSARVCSRKELLWEPTIPSNGLRGKVYDMVKKNDFEPLTSYCGYDVDKLTTTQRVLDFSIVDYMLRDSKKIREWLRHVKDHKDQGRAFRDVYEVSMSEFVDNWAAWVLATYKPGMH